MNHRLKYYVQIEYLIFFIALISRLIALFIIFYVTPKYSIGFISDSPFINDDVRFEAGGLLYASSASKLIDIDAFKSAYAYYGDWVGYQLNNPFINPALWYWIICIILYITHNVIFVRLFNVIIASFACVAVYRFGNNAYNYSVGKTGALLISLLPYPVFFSCFAYRDYLIMLCSFVILDKAVLFNKNKCLSFKSGWLVFAFFSMLLLLLRSGISTVLIGICFFIMFNDELKRFRFTKRNIIFIILAFGLLVFLIVKNSALIQYKLASYMESRSLSSDQTSISFFVINGFSDIYKLPFSYLLSMIMPIGIKGDIDSWSAIISNINIVMVVFSTGAFFNLFNRNKSNRLTYWLCLAYYFLYLITSIGIFRHYFSLIPINLLAFSEFYHSANQNERIVLYSTSTLYATALLIYYL